MIAKGGSAGANVDETKLSTARRTAGSFSRELCTTQEIVLGRFLSIRGSSNPTLWMGQVKRACSTSRESCDRQISMCRLDIGVSGARDTQGHTFPYCTRSQPHKDSLFRTSSSPLQYGARHGCHCSGRDRENACTI